MRIVSPGRWACPPKHWRKREKTLTALALALRSAYQNARRRGPGVLKPQI